MAVRPNGCISLPWRTRESGKWEIIWMRQVISEVARAERVRIHIQHRQLFDFKPSWVVFTDMLLGVSEEAGRTLAHRPAFCSVRFCSRNARPFSSGSLSLSGRGSSRLMSASIHGVGEPTNTVHSMSSGGLNAWQRLNGQRPFAQKPFASSPTPHLTSLSHLRSETLPETCQTRPFEHHRRRRL